jgi:3-phenylpropionate/cinnamic acid dioxygenase small subunit
MLTSQRSAPTGADPTGEITRFDPTLTLADRNMLVPAREFPDQDTVVMQTLWPNLMVQQQTNTLAMMRCEGRAGLRDRVHAIEHSSVFAPRVMRHIVSGLRIRPATGGLLRVTASFAVLQSLVGQHTIVFAAGQYRDTVRVDGGGAVFTEKKAVYDSALVVNSMVYPL